MAIISPSLLSADPCLLPQAMEMLVQAGIGHTHIDIMDGHFVPNLSFGPGLVNALCKRFSFHSEAHLMVENPEYFAPRFIDAGAQSISIHLEATRSPIRLLEGIRQMGAEAGLVLNPATPLGVLEHLWGYLDFLLLMTVEPGYGGQGFLPFSWQKIRQAKAEILRQELPVRLEVDGGVDPENALRLVELGVDELVVGAAIFRAEDPRSVLLQLQAIAASGRKGTKGSGGEQ